MERRESDNEGVSCRAVLSSVDETRVFGHQLLHFELKVIAVYVDEHLLPIFGPRINVVIAPFQFDEDFHARNQALVLDELINLAPERTKSFKRVGASPRMEQGACVYAVPVRLMAPSPPSELFQALGYVLSSGSDGQRHHGV